MTSKCAATPESEEQETTACVESSSETATEQDTVGNACLQPDQVEGESSELLEGETECETETPSFDRWSLTPDQQALFLELKTANEARQTEIVNELRQTHKVPRSVIQGVLSANSGFFGASWDAIRTGGWHTVGTDDSGEITHEFRLDGSGLGWQNDSHVVEIGPQGAGAEFGYERRRDDETNGWDLDVSGERVTSGRGNNQAVGGGGEVHLGLGGEIVETLDEDGEVVQTEVGAQDITLRGSATPAANDSQMLGASGGVTYESDELGVTADAERTTTGVITASTTVRTGTRENGERTVAADVGITPGRRDDDPSTYAVSGSHVYDHRDEDGAGFRDSSNGSVSVTPAGPDEDSGATWEVSGGHVHQEYRREGEGEAERTIVRREAGEATVGHDEGTTAVAGEYSVSDNETDRTSGSGELRFGETTGGELEFEVDRDRRDLSGSASYYDTQTDEEHEQQGAASVTLGRGPGTEVDEEGRRQDLEGDTTTVTISGSGHRTRELESGDETLEVGGSVGATHNLTSAEVSYERTDAQGEETFVLDEIGVEVAQGFELDSNEEEESSLVLTLSAGTDIDVRADEDGQTVDWQQTATAQWVTTEEDKVTERLTIQVAGGEAGGADVGTRVLGADAGLITGGEGGVQIDDEARGAFASVSGSSMVGDQTHTGTFAAGQVGNTSLTSAHYTFTDADRRQPAHIDLMAAMATTGTDYGALLRATTEFAVSDSVDISAGSRVILNPSDPSHSVLWDVYAGTTFEFDRDQSLELEMGVSSNGETVAYIPSITYQYGDKLTAQAMASFSPGRQASAGLLVGSESIPVQFLTGYGDPTLLTNSFTGSAIDMPGIADNSNFMGTGSQDQFYIGVQADLIGLFRKGD